MPREHGAWAMLLIPFVSALLLARRLTWETLPAAVAVVGMFLVREPLVVLWRGFGETQAARASLAWYGPAIALSGTWLAWRLPWKPLAALGLMAAALLAVSTHLVANNQRRSVLLQLCSAAGLNASAAVGWLAVRQEIETPVLWLWGLQFAHSAASLLTIHARLEARIAARRKQDVDRLRSQAGWAQGFLVLAAVFTAALGGPLLSLALLFSGFVHTRDLLRMRNPEFLATPLTRVGLRELAISGVFSALVLVGLW